jgi:D-alanyl-D-alanine endopeptidase (penicillin-binding protein 7)
MIRPLTLVFAAFIVLPAASAADLDAAKLRLSSANVLVFDAKEGKAVYAKAADEVTPIASLTKLMTAMVVLDANQPMDDVLSIDMDDFDYLKGSHSRLRMGTTLTRAEMLRLALMSSENRAASALARHYPGGTLAFVAAMNEKAMALGMTRTHYDDSTGLSPKNVSTANDLARLVRAAADYPVIRDYSTTPSHYVETNGGQTLGFNNSNALVKSSAWDIQLQKTGYIREAGRCVVMLANIASKPMVIVLLDSIGKFTRTADAQRVKHWLETGDSLPAATYKAVMKQKAPKSTAGKRIQGKFAATKVPRG